MSGICADLKTQPCAPYQELGGAFFDPVAAANFPKTILRYRNQRAAEEVGLEGLSDEAWVQHFGRFQPIAGSLESPLALRYHGHQFDQYNPAIGDGRGFLFAQFWAKDGRLLDLGTKGSGTTPHSRSGDGRLTLKGGVREVLATTLLEARGLNTSRSFSLIETGESLHRGDEPSPTRSSVLVRLSHSHIRYGTFQRLAYEELPAEIEKLVRHSAKYYFQESSLAELSRTEGTEQLCLEFFREVLVGAARTTAQWMMAGFVHGVLNSDNMNITSESFDYGPYRFLSEYDDDFTAAYFDHTSLYAYGRQWIAVAKNLSRLASCLVAFASTESLAKILDGFDVEYQRALDEALLARLGLKSAGSESDRALRQAWVAFLKSPGIAFDRPFHDWVGGEANAALAMQSYYSERYESEEFQKVRRAWQKHEAQEGAAEQAHYLSEHPPEGLLIREIESIWSAIDIADDWRPFEAKLSRIEASRPSLRVASKS